MRMMANSGLNTEGMMRLMEMLQKETVGKEPAAFMSTHPVFKDRIENIRKEMVKYPASSQDNPKLKKLFHDLYEEW
jgi:predicted Zn-dependent protease